MTTNDFSTPRRMSRSAFAVYFINNLKNNINIFIIGVIIQAFNNKSDDNIIVKTLIVISVMFGICLLLAAITAFIPYYSRKYYVENGKLIFIHGLLHKESVSMPLCKIHSLRTKQGFIYRLLEIRGVTFDNLASNSAEIEMVLDEEDWNALICQVGTLHEDSEIETRNNNRADFSTPINNQPNRIVVSNSNLIKGALCQSNIKGILILMGVLLSLIQDVYEISENATLLAFEYMESQASSVSFSTSFFILIAVSLYLINLILWAGRVFFRYANMDILISEKQLICECGLISRNSSRFSYDKVSTIFVKQNILEKLTNCCTIKLKQAINATDEKQGTNVVVYGSDSAPEFLNWWLGEKYTSAQNIATAQSGIGVFWHTIAIDFALSVLAGTAIYYWFGYPWMLLPAIYMTISAFKGVLAVNHSQIELKDNFITVSNGKFAEIKNYCKYSNIEVVRITATPFTPLFHRVNLFISTNGSSFTIRSLKEEQAKNIHELLLSKCSNK